METTGPTKFQECKNVSDFNSQLLEIESDGGKEHVHSEVGPEHEQEMPICCKPEVQIKERPGKQSVKISKSNVIKLLDSNNNDAKDHDEQSDSPKSGQLAVVGKCPSTISSYVGGFLATQKNG